MSDVDIAIEKWKLRVDEKTQEITSNFNKGILKAALFCEGEALKNAMSMIYNVPVPTLMNGEPEWKRTGLYKASMGAGMNPDKRHSAIVYNTAPYAEILEYGDSKGHQGKSIMSNSVFNNKPQIKAIMDSFVKGDAK